MCVRVSDCGRECERRGNGVEDGMRRIVFVGECGGVGEIVGG